MFLCFSLASWSSIFFTKLKGKKQRCALRITEKKAEISCSPTAESAGPAALQLPARGSSALGWDVGPGRAGPCRQDAWVSILCQGRDGPHGVERQSQIPAAPTLFPPFCLLTSPGLEGSSGSRARPRQHAALHGTRLSGKGRPSQLCWQGEGGTGHCRKTLPLLQIFTRGAPWVWQEGACFPPPSSSILPGTPCRTPRFPGPVLPVVTGHCNSRETPWWDELQAPLTPQLAALSHLPLPSLAGSCCTLTWALPSLLVGPLSSHSLLDEGGKQSLCLSPCWRFFLAALSPPPGGCSSVGGSAAGLGVL